MEDWRIIRLRELLEEATALQAEAMELVTELTDQLHRSVDLYHDTADDQPRLLRRERRNDPLTSQIRLVCGRTSRKEHK